MRVARRAHFGIILFILGALSRPGQSQSPSPDEIIRQLTTIDRNDPAVIASEMGPSCAGVSELPYRRQMALSLVRMGPSAVPAMSAALTEFEKTPRWLFADWVLYAYAKSLGPASLPRLRAMSAHSMSGFHDVNVAIALAMGLTSYANDRWPLGALFLCRYQEPRDALDDVIVSFENGGLKSLERMLGPEAQAALDGPARRAVEGTSRTKLSKGKAVGYRFNIGGPWAEPEESLDEKLEQQRMTDRAMSKSNASVDTSFKTAKGTDCGRLEVVFVRARDADHTGRWRFYVDNPDIAGLLRVIESCAARSD